MFTSSLLCRPQAQHHLSCMRPYSAQRISITLVEDQSKMSGASEGIVRRLLCSVFFAIWSFWNKESRALRTKIHPAKECYGGNRSVRRSAVRAPLPEIPPPRALRIVPMCKEPPAAGARGRRYQSNSRGNV